MKAFKIFSMAAVAFMMVACSSEDTVLDNTPIAGQKVHFTATIAAPGSDALTRTTYTEITSGTDAGKIKVAWEQGDEIALIHNGTKDVVTVQTLNADGSANISGDITVGTDGEAVTILYPAATVNAPASGAVPVEDATYATKWNSQDGTLTYIQDYLDYCKATSTLKVSGTKATLNDNISMESTIAIFKFTIQDLSAADKTATEFKVSDAFGNVIATVTPGSATGTLYVALPVMAAGTYWFNATIDTKAYVAKATTTTTTTAGTYYQSTVKMATIGDVILEDGTFAARSSTTGTIVAMIAYLGSETDHATYKHGLALALSDKGQMSWTDATGASGAAAHTPAAPTTTSSWMLPSKDQWNNMIDACKNVLGTQNNYQDLRDGFSGISGASNLQSLSYSAYYWSSTEYDSGLAWGYGFGDGDWFYDYKINDFERVRACLAF